jgi:hypothetical protein
MTITAIETHYAGYRFRSRLEARWAVFFTTLGINWQYEPQGYTVGRTKTPYLPDFLLPDLQTFVEVKGDPARLDLNLLAELTGSRDALRVLILGDVPHLEAGAIPLHTLLTPVFDFRPSPSITTFRPGLEAIGRLSEEDQTAVHALLRHHSRTAIACYPAFFMAATNGAELLPLAIPAWNPTPVDVLNPSPIWPILPMPRVESAYRAARSARFEHGETPS